MEIIHQYTRAQAIEDGVLVDLSALEVSDSTRIYKYPIAVTAAVFEKIEAGVGDGRTVAGIVHDVLFMSAFGPAETVDKSTKIFKVSIANKVYRFKAICGPGDQGEPVITIMLPSED